MVPPVKCLFSVAGLLENTAQSPRTVLHDSSVYFVANLRSSTAARKIHRFELRMADTVQEKAIAKDSGIPPFYEIV